jgi:hypothetical protein
LRHHATEDCPLAAPSSDAGFEKIAHLLKKFQHGRSTPASGVWGHKCFTRIPQTDTLERLEIPSDGNCLFAAIFIGYGRCKASAAQKINTALTLQQRGEKGAQCRTWFFDLVKGLMQRKAELHPGLGVTVEEVLLESGCWATPDEYVSAMSTPLPNRGTWGGFAEASVMAFHWKVRVAFFALTECKKQVFLLCDPAGPQGATARICLLWTGSHYELLVLDDAAWMRACTPAGEPL